MSIPIFSNQQQFEGSGSFFVSGTSTQIIPGTLSLNNQIAYCKGPPSAALAANRSTSSGSQQVMTKIWRAYFNNVDQRLHLERTTTGSNIWESVTTTPIAPNWVFAIDSHINLASASFKIPSSINNIDLAFDNYGYYYIVLEIPTVNKVMDDHITDVLIFTNSYIGSVYDTAGSILTQSGTLSGSFSGIDGISYNVTGPDASRSNPYYIGSTYPSYPPTQPTLGNIAVLSTNALVDQSPPVLQRQVIWNTFPNIAQRPDDVTVMLYIPNARSPKVMWDGV